MKSEDAPEPILAVEHLRVSYQGRLVLADINFTLRRHQISAFAGVDGAGKTTILKALAGLRRPVAGKILFEGEAIEGLPAWEVVKRGIVYVPEGMRVFPQMTVVENLEVGAYLKRVGIPARLDLVFNIFPELKEKVRLPAGVLSGGQQRMVTLARGLMAAPRLLLLDEPFMGLSPKLVKRFCDSFRDLRQAGITLLIAGQYVFRVLNVAEVAHLVEHGRITLSGSGPELLRDQHLKEILFATCDRPLSGDKTGQPG
jgi:branched-chain amino acid transport system ATP-binding protein